jgi:hypothetical protein
MAGFEVITEASPRVSNLGASPRGERQTGQLF